MSRRSARALIWLGIAAAVLILVLALILILPRLKGADSDGTSVLVPLEEIDSLSFNCGEDFCTFKKEDGNWFYSGDPSLPISQSRLNRLASALEGLSADRVFTDGEALSAYGLDPAVYTVQASGSGGASVELLLGNSCGDGSVYAVSDQIPGICVISDSLTKYYLGYSLLEMLDVDPSPLVTEADQISLRLTCGNGIVTLTQEDGSWFLETADGPVKEDDLKLTDPEEGEHTLRKYMNDLSDALPSLKTSVLAGYDCSAEELTAFGLDQPLAAVFTAADGTETTYLLGFEAEDDSGTSGRYMMTSGSDAVYFVTDAGILFRLFDLLS